MTSPTPSRQNASPAVNEDIRLHLAADKYPLLPFEVAVLSGRWDAFTEEQKVLGATMREAMSESSETWHDNAPADAVMHASKALANQATSLSRLMKHRVELTYPSGEQAVTIGSVVGLHFGEDPETESYLLTGAVRVIPEEISTTLPAGTTAVTVSSPLGEAVFGKYPGETAEYEVSSRKIGITVVEVTQLGDILSSGSHTE